MNEIREASSSMESGANQSFGAYKNIWSEHGSRCESGMQSQDSQQMIQRIQAVGLGKQQDSVMKLDSVLSSENNESNRLNVEDLAKIQALNMSETDVNQIQPSIIVSS